MTSSTNQRRSKDDPSRMFDSVRGADGFDRYLVNKGFYIAADNVSPGMIQHYEVRDNDTYTNISYKFYGTIELWWLVCKMNDVHNPFERLNSGTKLNILKREYVNSIVYPLLDAAESVYANNNVN